MLKTERETDTKAEKIIGEFLDKNLYSQIRATADVNFERITDKKRQIAGIDVLIGNENSKIYIDEKIQLDYINKNLPTNCFEISFLDRYQNLKQGWFVDNGLMTTHYLIIWPFTNSPSINKENLTLSDISHLECLLISKCKIQKYLERNGFSKEVMLQIADSLRKSGDRKKKIYGKSFYFTYTQTKAELPVNIIIRKEILLQLASRVYDVSENSLKILSKEDIRNKVKQLSSKK